MLQFGVGVFLALGGFFAVIAYGVWIVMESHKRKGK